MNQGRVIHSVSVVTLPAYTMSGACKKFWVTDDAPIRETIPLITAFKSSCCCPSHTTDVHGLSGCSWSWKKRLDGRSSDLEFSIWNDWTREQGPSTRTVEDLQRRRTDTLLPVRYGSHVTNFHYQHCPYTMGIDRTSVYSRFLRKNFHVVFCFCFDVVQPNVEIVLLLSRETGDCANAWCLAGSDGVHAYTQCFMLFRVFACGGTVEPFLSV